MTRTTFHILSEIISLDFHKFQKTMFLLKNMDFYRRLASLIFSISLLQRFTGGFERTFQHFSKTSLGLFKDLLYNCGTFSDMC